MPRQYKRSILCHGFQLSKEWFFENIWSTIPQSVKDDIEGVLNTNNSKTSYQIALFEIWRYSTMYVNVYGYAGVNDFITDYFIVPYQ